jgi:hypothetical protein
VNPPAYLLISGFWYFGFSMFLTLSINRSLTIVL